MIISLPRCTRSTSFYTRVQASFIIFRWKKGGQKYTEYPRRHPVDYFENIIAKRGEEKRERGNGEEMEKGQARLRKPGFSSLTPFLAPSLSLLHTPLPLLSLPPPRNGPFSFRPEHAMTGPTTEKQFRTVPRINGAHSNSTRFFLLSKISLAPLLQNCVRERTLSPPLHLPSSSPRFLRVIDLDLEILDRFVERVHSLPSFSFLFLFFFFVASYVFAHE